MIKKIKIYFNFIIYSYPFFWGKNAPEDVQKTWNLANYRLKNNFLLKFRRINLLSFFIIIGSYFKLHSSYKTLKQKTGVGYKSYLSDSLRLIHKQKLPLRYYFIYNLWIKTKFKDSHLIMPDYRTKYFFKAINITNSTQLKNKFEFSLLCQKNNINSPNTLLLDKKTTWVETELANKSIIIKPNLGYGSKEIKIINYISPNLYEIIYSQKKKNISKELLAKRISKISTGNFIIQEKLFNHSSLNQIGNGELCIVRIISMLNENEEIEFYRPILKVPTRNSSLCEVHHGALIIKIDLETGILGTGFCNRIYINPISNNPYNNKCFIGIKIPYWKRLITDCRKMHNAMRDFKFIAWDAAITESGVYIIEGNQEFGIEYHHRAYEKDNYHSRLFALIKYYIAGVNETD